MLYDFLCESVQTQFSCVKVLKEGRNGRVSLIRHREKGTLMVLRTFSGDAKIYKKLLTVECAHLPRIAEAAEKDGTAMVLEEFIQGDSLEEVLQGGTLTPRQTEDIARQLCRGLWVLHAMGVVHRDIKPSNVILRGDEAVLIDFNASRFYNPMRNRDTEVLGTVGYAAPEQYGISQSDGRSDIYSMGVLLNVMLTGKHPSVQQAGGRLGRVIQRCTAMHPEKRYQTVAQLMTALERRGLSMKRNCLNCGAQLPEDASFCPYCVSSQVSRKRLEPPRKTRSRRWLAVLGVAVLVLAAFAGGRCFNGRMPVAEKDETPSAANSQPGQSVPEDHAELSEDPSDEMSLGSVSESTPSSEPIPVGEQVELTYHTNYIRRNGTSSEGVTFTGVNAVKLSDGSVRFTVSLVSEQNFYASVFEPPEGPWIGYIGSVAAGQTSLSFTVSWEQLKQLNSITVKLYNFSGSTGTTGDEDDVNRAWLSIDKSALEQVQS